MAHGDRERWDQRYRDAHHDDPAPPTWLDALDLPREGRALDVASGVGRVALWLAKRGLDVTAIDVSAVALERLEARSSAFEHPVSVRAMDLEREPLPEGPFDVVACFYYLQRDLFPALAERLAPGGTLLVELPTVRNLERHAKPSRRFLIDERELGELVGDLEVLHYAEGWFDDRAVARCAARRPRSGAHDTGV